MIRKIGIRCLVLGIRGMDCRFAADILNRLGRGNRSITVAALIAAKPLEIRPGKQLSSREEKMGHMGRMGQIEG